VQRFLVMALALAGSGLLLAPTIASRLRRYWRETADVAAEAKEYLRERDVTPLAKGLPTLIGEARFSSISTLEHPLLGRAAPDFQLSDHTGQRHSLAEHLQRGPVVLVFYYGYYCNHCVGQLFALQDDLSLFRESGAQVLAMSADPPEATAEKFTKFGAFDYPVLSDPDNRTAEAYSLYTPAAAGKAQRLLHGTFVIDQAGTVRWCHYGPAPFTANGTLLYELSRLSETGKLSQDVEP
jgi:peroxiredoxin